MLINLVTLHLQVPVSSQTVAMIIFSTSQIDAFLRLMAL